MRSMSIIGIECRIAFLEIRLFLENHSLEFNEIWLENTFLGITGTLKKKIFNREIFGNSSELQQGIIKDLSVKLLCTLASLLHGNCKENLTTTFFANKNRFLSPAYNY